MKSTCRHLAGFLLLAIVVAARAEEGGVGHYAPGSFASFVDVLPGEPGLGVFNYFAYYNGDASANHQFPIAGQAALNVEATSYADSFGAFWVTPLSLLGVNYAPGVSIPFVWTDVKAQVSGPGGRTVNRSDSASGLGDIEFWPVALSWTTWSTNLHVDFFGGIYAPTGRIPAEPAGQPGAGLLDLRAGPAGQLPRPEERHRVHHLHRLRHQHREHHHGLPERAAVPH